jgi:asparagine synthase (glutamine-hydrolysing)
MIADVPLGAFLSGGVDSSAVVAMMAGIAPNQVNTFSIAFGDKQYDESQYANAMAERYRTQHRARTVDPEAFDLVDTIARIYDEPFGDSSALPTLRLCAATREHVTVALSGDGGDELFAGYRRYLAHASEERVRRLLPQGVRGPLFGFLGSVYPKLDWAPRFLRGRTTFQELALDPVRGYFSSISVANDEMRGKLFNAATKRELAGYNAISVIERYMSQSGSGDPVSQAQYTDIKTYLPGDILTKVDRAAMACSLETRVPLLDHRIVEWAGSIPSDMKLHGRTGKHVFKQALRPHVSDDILFRPKQGFSMPLARWFRGPLHEQLRAALTDGRLADSGLFDVDFIGTLLDQHRSGLRDHAAVLWVLLCFASFLRVDQARAAPPAAATPERLRAYGGR